MILNDINVHTDNHVIHVYFGSHYTQIRRQLQYNKMHRRWTVVSWHQKLSARDWNAAARRSEGSVFTENIFEKKLLCLTN